MNNRPVSKEDTADPVSPARSLSPAERRSKLQDYFLRDYGFLRVLWTNLYEVAPGVWRSNQPSPRRLRRYRDMGIRSILNLRGEASESFYALEQEACGRLGLNLENLRISPRRVSPQAAWLELFEIFDRIEKPFVVHCKSGADRAGLASALWLMDQEGATYQQAKRQLSLRYLHIASTRTGILDHILQTYDRDTRTDPMPVRQWFAERFVAEDLTNSFRNRPARDNGPAG